jgi:8-oxo-dGTP pyrophosphatase MutT (NUDIX family)
MASERMPEPIRPAATVILWRDGSAGPSVLMGQRGAGAVFMPSKFVFPGGSADPADAAAGADGLLAGRCRRRLGLHSQGIAPGTLAAAARRELAEEAGLRLAAPGSLRFIFRAITPPGRTRRFDARFFLSPASALDGDPDDLSGASGELSALTWVPLAAARTLDLPFVTEVALAEVGALLRGEDDAGVPFFDNGGARPVFRRLV